MLSLPHQLKTLKLGNRTYFVAQIGKPVEQTKQGFIDVDDLQYQKKLSFDFDDQDNIEMYMNGEQVENKEFDDQENSRKSSIMTNEQQPSRKDSEINNEQNQEIFRKKSDANSVQETPENTNNEQHQTQNDQQQYTKQDQEKEKQEEQIECKLKLVKEMPKKTYTHFLNIPIKTTKSFVSKLAKFRKLANQIDPEISKFEYHGKPHFTLAVLNLDQEQEQIYGMILGELQAQLRSIAQKDIFVKKKTYKFDVSGLDYFWQQIKNPIYANVVFADLKDPNTIKKFDDIADCIFQNLSQMGMLDMKEVPHVTFDTIENKYKINRYHITLYKKNPNQHMIDASKILGKLSQFKFGSLEYDCVSLNRMEKDHPEVISLSLIQQLNYNHYFFLDFVFLSFDFLVFYFSFLIFFFREFFLVNLPFISE